MKGKETYEGFTLSLALVDALPVLLFGASILLIGILYFRSPLFLIGAAFSFLAGFLKVLWKILLAAKGRDIVLLNRQFRVLMTCGFLLIILSLVLHAKSISFPAVWRAISGFPSALFFLLWFVGMLLMGILGRKLDSTKASSNWIEQGVNAAAQLFLLLGILFVRGG